MKQVLSLLTAFIFLQMQTWALSGGPVFPSSSPNQAGNYSGVFIPQESRFNLGVPENEVNNFEPTLDTGGKIGVFGVLVPLTGVATGTSVMFFNGSIFTGTINGVADPDRGTFDGILQLTGSFDIITTPQQIIINPVDGTVTIVPAITSSPLAQGEMRCKIVEARTTPLAGRTSTANGNAARMTGSARVDSFVFVDNTGRPIPIVQVRFSVTGYRQNTLPLT